MIVRSVSRPTGATPTIGPGSVSLPAPGPHAEFAVEEVDNPAAVGVTSGARMRYRSEPTRGAIAHDHGEHPRTLEAPKPPRSKDSGRQRSSANAMVLCKQEVGGSSPPSSTLDITRPGLKHGPFAGFHGVGVRRRLRGSDGGSTDASLDHGDHSAASASCTLAGGRPWTRTRRPAHGSRVRPRSPQKPTAPGG